MIWKRATIDKKTALLSGKTINLLGWASLFIAFLGLFVNLSEGFKSEDVGIIIFFLLVGAYLLALGKKIRNNAKKNIRMQFVTCTGCGAHTAFLLELSVNASSAFLKYKHNKYKMKIMRFTTNHNN